MKCSECRKPISKQQEREAEVVRQNGKVTGALHKKCAHILRRRLMLKETDRPESPTAYAQHAARVTSDDLTEEARERREKAEAMLASLKKMQADNKWAMDDLITRDDGKITLAELLHDREEAVALARRQEEIAAERAKEARPEQFDDWRGPAEVEI